MPRKNFVELDWDNLSRLFILAFAVLQAIRLPLLPQFMDIYYHILSGWGFAQAGGYSSWDFWEFAPYGRPHIYPPLFHIIFALLLKLRVPAVVLAKFFEMIAPTVFLAVLWRFIRSNFGKRLAFWCVFMFNSSFSFYLSLSNHIPATFSLILAILCLDQLLKPNIARSGIFLALCFYTHIGISWISLLCVIFFGFFNVEYRRRAFLISFLGVLLAAPIIFKEIASLKAVSSFGWQFYEKYNCEFKIIEYVLAVFGISLAVKNKKLLLLLCFSLASLPLLIYPYRFFSAEGYIPVIIFSAVALDKMCDFKMRKFFYKGLFLFFLGVLLIGSVTVSLSRQDSAKITAKPRFFDTAIVNLLLARGGTIWFPNEYIYAASLAKSNSQDNDIIYSNLNVLGLAVAGISGRASANGLLPEVAPLRKFDPYAVSKIIILTKYGKEEEVNRIVSAYGLTRIGENKICVIFKNPFTGYKADIRRATIGFPLIMVFSLFFSLFFLLARNKQ